MNISLSRKHIIGAGMALALSLSVAMPALAHGGFAGFWGAGANMGKTPLVGTVTAVSGTTITLSGKVGTSTATTLYSVDASGAKIFKVTSGTSTTTKIQPTEIQISGIALGDTLSVIGTLTGTSSVAKTIIDGTLPTIKPVHDPSKNPSLKGMVFGTISATTSSGFTLISKGWKHGSTTPVSLTVTTVSTTTITKDGKTASLSDLVNGALVFVKGEKNASGTSIVAASIAIFTKDVTKDAHDGNKGFFGMFKHDKENGKHSKGVDR